MEDKDYDWLRFFPNRFYFGTMEMPDHVVGRYIKLLCQEWFNGDISSNLTGMDDILEVVGEIVSVDNSSGASRGVQQNFGTNPNSVIRIRLNRDALWDALKTKFVPVGHGRYVNNTLEEEREDTKQRIQKQEVNRINGSKGGHKSAALRSVQNKSSSSHAPTIASSGASSFGLSENSGPVQPITLQYISNLNYPQGFLENGGNGTDNMSERIQQLVTANFQSMSLAGSLHGRPPAFVQFAIDYWIRDVIAKGLNISEQKLRENFVDVVSNRIGEIEKAYARQSQDEHWFTEELDRVAEQMQAKKFLVKKFKDYYLKALPSGGYFFQTFPNFSVEKTLTEWIANERPARGQRGDREPVSNVQPLVKPSPTTYVPSPNEKQKLDDDIKRALNRKYESYRLTGDTRTLNITEFTFLHEFGCDLPDEKDVTDKIIPKIVDERRKKIEETKEGKDAEGTKRLYDLKRQYATNQLDDEEKRKILRESYVRAITKFFDKLKKKEAERVFDM
jgi:hypothetical protein